MEGNYLDITYKLRKKKIGFLKIRNTFIDSAGIKHPISKKETVHKIPTYYNSNTGLNNEMRVAKFLIKKIGARIYLIPRITDNNYGVGVSTPDYYANIDGRYEYWELKSPRGSSKNTIDSILKKKKQANNYIIDITYSNISISDAKISVIRIISSPYRNWIKKIMLIYKNRIVFLYQRKK